MQEREGRNLNFKAAENYFKIEALKEFERKEKCSSK